MAEPTTDVDDPLALGRKLLKKRRYAEASKCFAAALEANAHDVAAHELMATLAFVTKDYELAIEHFREASRCDARRPEPMINLGAVLNKVKRYKEAIDVLQKSLAKNRNSAEAYYNLGIAYRGAGNSGMAVSAYKEAIRQKSDFAEAHQNLGNAYLDQNNKRQAVTAFARALELSPDLAGAKKGLQKAREVGAPRPSPLTGTGAAYASGISAPPVVLTEIQRAADREIVNEAAKRVERSVLAFQSEIQMTLEPAVKKLSKAVMSHVNADSSGTVTKISSAVRDVDQIVRLLGEARTLLIEHEDDLLHKNEQP